jgi:hypothetical protein
MDDDSGAPDDGRVSDRPPPDSHRISREQARIIAEEHLARPGALVGGAGIRGVYALAELDHREPTVYGVDLQHCWIAYVQREQTGVLVIRSSDIVLVSMTTGDVVYAGSASDEG